MSPPSQETSIADYKLLELKHESACNRLWFAEQTSIGRKVALMERRSSSPWSKEDFLAEIRAKASVDHPLVGSVYEASEEGDRTFAALEFLPGEHLARRKNEGRKMEPAELARLLKRVAEAYTAFEAVGTKTSALRLKDIFHDGQGVVRLKNLAVVGTNDPACSVEDISLLGRELPELVVEGRPGATRLALLFSWMRGDGLDAPLVWSQVGDYCTQIEQQLGDSQHFTKPVAKTHLPSWIWVALGIVVLGIPATFVLSGALDRPNARKKKGKSPLPPAVAVEKGAYTTADGVAKTLGPFSISAHETTIGQYQDFLAALDTLTSSGKQHVFDDPSQPATKTGHAPDDWSALLEAAKAGGTWKGHPVTLDSPVVGVDWWDAIAYAHWNGGDLPEQDEWFAALGKDAKFPEKIPTAAWVPVDGDMKDKAPSGVLAMAGSVSEWCKSPAPDPSNPLGAPRWILAGGSYAKPGSNATSREWVGNRLLRRPDVGFRVVYRTP